MAQHAPLFAVDRAPLRTIGVYHQPLRKLQSDFDPLAHVSAPVGLG
jgi:hypothetical protein